MMKGTLFVLLFIFQNIYCGHSPNGKSYLASLSPSERSQIHRGVEEDVDLDVPGLLKKYGYPNEVHTVKTSDGYKLTMHRIKGGKNASANSTKPPVLVMHGLLSSSADWIIMGPGNGLGYILADEGYDVWMGNFRGNFYSKAHVSLNPKKSKFWKFSWHEMGLYDLPAMIDYVLEKTKKPKLHYVGHSQGTTTFFVMTSNKKLKEYNDKIVSMQALAPIAFMRHFKSPIVRLIAPMAQTIETAATLFGANEFFPSNSLTSLIADSFCSEGSLLLPMCKNLLFLTVGYDTELLNVTMLPVIGGHTPAGSSSRQMVHYCQEHMDLLNRFRQYNYFLLNPTHYKGSPLPPTYDLGRITAPVALHYSLNDWLAAEKDVKKLHKSLPNSIGLFKVPFKKFNHLDFLWAINIRYYVYDRMLTLMKAWEN